MPDTSRSEKNDCEKKKIHNSIEKKRKDKLKVALGDLRKYLPASLTVNKKLSHHEVLLKAIEYMKELEVENKKLVLGPSDDVKGEIIVDLKTKLEDCHKEIGNLKTIIEKNCTSAHSIELVQSWKSKEKASKACQAGGSSTPSTDCSSTFKNILVEKNKKQKKGFTIAQRLNQATELSNTRKQCSNLADSNHSKSSVTLDDESQITEVSVDASHNSVATNLANKESNSIILCFNDKFLAAHNSMHINSLSLVPSQQIEVTTNALVSNQVIPVSALPMLPFFNTGISHVPLSALNSEVLIDDNVMPDKQEDSHKNKVAKADTNESKKRKRLDKNHKKFKILHCCNWYWRNLKWKRKVLKHLTRRKVISSTSSAETQTPAIPTDVSSMTSQEDVENNESVSKEKDLDGNKDQNISQETFESSVSNSSKSNKPIWIVAKNMTEPETNSSEPKDCDIGDISTKGSLEQNSKVQSNLMIHNQFEAVSFSMGCHNNSHQKSDYHEISSLLLNPISTFPELYERNTAGKAVEQSFLEDAHFYNTGVAYLNEDNDLQFEIEDMFQPSTSPFTNHVSFEKTKHKDARKDFINFSFHNEIFNSFPLTDTFPVQSNCNPIDKGSCVNYKQPFFQNANIYYPSTIYSNNFQHGSISLSNVELPLPKTSSTICTQFNSISVKPPILHASDKNGYIKASNANCMFDNVEKNNFSDNTCSRISNKENKTFNPELKCAQNNPYAMSYFDTAGVSIFNPYSNYNSDKMWTHNSSMSFLPPKPNPTFQNANADISKNIDTSYPFINNHISTVSKLPTDKNKCFSLKNKTSSAYFESPMNGEDRAVESISKFQNSANGKEKEKTCLSEDFPLSGEGVTKVVYTVSHQVSSSTKLWNPDQYALNSKPFSFYPFSYNDKVSKTAFNTKNSGSERNSEATQNKNCVDNFSNSSVHNDGFKSNPQILSFVPPIKSSFSCVESDVINHHLPSNLTSNFYPVSSNELYTKHSEISGNWSKNSSVKNGSNNFNPFTSANMPDNSENNLFRYQTSPISNMKVNSFSSGNLNSMTTSSLNSTMNKSSSSLKRNASSNPARSSKKLNKGSSQDFFNRSQKPAYYGSYSSQNSYNASDLLVGPFDRPTYLTGEDQFIPPYNSSEQASDLNLNNLFVPPLPSHQPNDVRLNLYQNQCSTGLSTTTPTKTLSNSRFSSALPSIHHFGINNIFNDFSHPLPLAVDANNLSLKVSQADSFMTSPRYYRENSMADVSIPAPSSGILETNYYPPHVPNIFNQAMKQTNSLSKNSMSINNLLGN